jgi:hypothetical protein
MRDGSDHDQAGRLMKICARIVLMFVAGSAAWAQAPVSGPQQPHGTKDRAWNFAFVMDGYFIPHDVDYGSPTFTADRDWLHLEARYNYEDLRTGSLWAGYNFSWGKQWEFAVTPIFGAVFGRTNGLAPGCEASLTYKRLELSISNEYVIVPEDTRNNFYYSWPQLTFSPTDWLRVGGVAQHSKAFQTSLDVQRGFFVGVNHNQWEVTTYVFNPEADPTVVLEFGVHF